jgi:hypothetical protein
MSSRARPKRFAQAVKSGNSAEWHRVGRLFALLLTAAGGVLLAIALGSAPGDTPYELTLSGLILLGCGVGILAASGDWLMGSPQSSTFSNKVFWGLVGLLGIALFMLILRFGMRQFGGFDHSVLVDVAWRLMQGQKPYVDFPCTLPPGFFLGAKYAFQIFGIKWRSLILVTAVFSLGLYSWALWLLLRIVAERYWALLLAVTIQATSLLLVSYWWYNPITSASAANFLLSATLFWHRPDDKAARLSYSLALLLFVLMKPNIVGIIVPLVSIVFAFSRRHRTKMLSLSAIAFVAFVLFLKLNEVTLPNLLNGYLAVARRGTSLDQFLQDLPPVEKRLSIVAFVLTLLPFLVSVVAAFPRLFARCPWFGLAGVLGGSYGFLTNGELKLVDLPPVLVGSFLVAAELRRNPGHRSGALLELSPGWRRYAAALCIILVFSGFAQGLTRHRVKAIGPGAFFQYNLTRHPFPDGFFKGLYSGEVFWEVNQQIGDLLRRESNASVAFGPRLQWSYVVFNKTSPPNQPIWWHPGVSFVSTDEPRYVARFLDARYDLLVLNKNDATYLPDYFLKSLAQRYTVDQSYSRLTVLRRLEAVPQ